jgi:hypothetical protein
VLVSDIVSEIIKSKTSKGQYIPSPDCPDKEDARLYFMFSDHVWEKSTVNEQCHELKGNIGNLSAQDTDHLSLPC